VRPNEDYLLICKEPVSEAAASRLGLTSCAVSLEDGTVYEFSVPARVSSEYDDALKELGLGRVLTTVVEPVGLVPRRAPGDVRTVWLATEEPIFALSSEALETEFIVTLDDAEVTRVAVQADGPTLVALSNLPLGPHRLQVASLTKSGQAQTREAEEIELEIRAPIPWSMDSMRAAGFRLALTPEGASIDDLIGGNAAATAIAPSGRTGQLTAQTFSSTGAPVDRIDLGQIRFPAQPRTMSQRLAKLGADPASEWVHQAPETVINLSLEELGTQSLRFRRRVDPLRWTLRRDDDSYLVRLIDDSDSEETVEVARYDIAQPDTKVSLDLATAMEGIRVDQPGALFSARLAKRSFRLAVSVSPPAVSSLAALGIGVYISDETKTATKIPRLLALIRLWRDAAWQGQLVLHRKEAVLRALDRALAEAVCGAKWSGRLEQFNHRSDADLADLQREVGGSPGFAHRMRTTNFFQPVDGQPPEQAFVNWAVGYKIVDDPSIAALAFKLAFHPTKLRVDDPGERVSTLSGVAANRPLCRGAFLARLASERLSRPPEIPA
jgi:hypothetical protein